MKKFLCVLLLTIATSLQALPLQVIIIRHGEKNPANAELLPKGIERAGALASYLTELDPDFPGTNYQFLAFGPPTVVFAARPVASSDDFTTRCIQTVIPVAQTLKLPIHSPYGPGQEQQFASFILNDHRYDGAVVLICWHHTFILQLIQAFGYNPSITHYPGDRYDLVWPMVFPAPVPAATLNPVLQELLFNDPTLPPT